MSYARTAVTRMTLDMSRLDLQRSETVTQGDTNRRWEVTLINGGAPFRLPPNWTAALTGIKPDGTGLLNGCSVADGKIIYDFATGKEIATCVGSYPVHFDIWDEVGELVASPKIYVNVLADERPHAELESDGQYTMIGDLIGRTNENDEKIDELVQQMADMAIAMMERYTKSGSITIPVSEWSDMMPTTAYVGIQGGEALVKGGLLLVTPADEATKKECERTGVRVNIDLVIDNQPPSPDQIVFMRADEAPTIPLNFEWYSFRAESEQNAAVVMFGVYSSGECGGVNQEQYEEIVKRLVPEWARAKNPPEVSKNAVGLGNVANVLQYSEQNPPPYPVTSVNNQTGAVTLSIPTKAADVGAATPETVNSKIKTHNSDNTAHEYIQQRIDALRTMVENFLDVDDETADQLSEVLQDINDNADALTALGTKKIDKTSISNSLSDSSPDHVPSMALITQLDQMIDDLDTGKTTPAQVAATLKTELASYIKTADIVNGLTSTDTDKPLSAAQGTRLKELIDLLDAGKLTSDEANDLISNALKNELKLYTPTDELPDALPTPHKLIINGVEFNGSETIQLDLDELPVVAYESEMTDHNQLYVLESTGHIWRYREVKGSTNWLKEVGYKYGVRVNNKKGAEITNDNPLLASITGYIPCKPGQKVTIRDLVFDDGNAGYGSIIPVYDQNKNIFSKKHLGYFSGNQGDVKKADNGDYYFTMPAVATTTSEDGSITAVAPVAFFRAQFSLTTPNPDSGNIAVGEEMTDYETGYHWVDTGIAYTWGNDTALLALEDRVTATENEIKEIKAKLASSLSVPDYWQDHIAAKIAEIQNAQTAARQRCVTWATVTDIHDDANAGGTGRLLKAVCDQCGISTVLCLGDYSTRATKATADRCRQSMGNSNNILAPVADRLLGVRGNHDGGYKTSDAYLLKPSEVDSIIQYPMATGLEITYDAVGSGYYATDSAHKVRYIMLNTDHRGANPDSTVASDGSSDYPYMSFYRYTQIQMEMVKEALNTIPNDSWTVVVASHVPPIGSVDRYGDGSFVVDLSIRLEDYLAMRKLLNAYVNRTTATVSFSGSATWDKINLSVDFTAAKGHLAEYQSGHLHRYLYFGADHVDPKSKTALGFPIRTIRSDGFNENYDSTNNSELDDAYANQRVLGTTTEHSFVVCVHNIDTRETTCIHIGAQED